MATVISSSSHHSADISLDRQARVAATSRSGSALTNGSTAEDLWSQILLSVETARSIPICPLVVLGEPQSGKSTLLRGLAVGCPSGYIESDVDEIEAEAGPSNHAVSALKDRKRGSPMQGKRDLGLGYGYCDVPDEEGEDLLARLSVFTLASSDEPLLPLLSYAFQSKGSKVGSLEPPRSSLEAIKHSIFLIALDWERPESFLEELGTWISVIKETIALATRADDERTRGQHEAFLQEMKDAVEAQIRSYAGPSTTSLGDNEAHMSALHDDAVDTSGLPAIVPVSAPLLLGDNRALPLDEGVLDDNLGVGIVIVLTKSDVLVEIERDRDFREEQFDYIQQVLRTICLKYGAALFSTAQGRPSSFKVLRQYLLHRLLPLNASQAVSAARYPFAHAPSTIERDVLLVPSGWDSWGKIVALKEGFSPRSTAQGWERDCEAKERRRRAARQPKASTEHPIDSEERSTDRGSACKLWEDIVGEWSARRPTDQGTTQAEPPDPQAFLSQHYAALQKDSAINTDPRSARLGRTSLAPRSMSGVSTPVQSERDDDVHGQGAVRGIVGPLQSGNLSGPAVERAMGLAQREEDSNLHIGGHSGSTEEASGTSDDRPKTVRRESREHRSGVAGSGLSSTLSSAASGGARAPLSAMVSGGRDSPVTSSPSATKQSEVLQSFFQELLRGKSGSGGGSGASPILRSGPPSSGRRSGQGVRSDGSASGRGGEGAGAGTGGGASEEK